MRLESGGLHSATGVSAVEPENGASGGGGAKLLWERRISVEAGFGSKRRKAVNRRVREIDAVGIWLPERNPVT